LKIGPHGKVTTVASGFPSSISNGGVLGVADVAFLDGTLYALIAGGGCSHGNPNSPNGVARVDLSTHQWSLIANLSHYVQTHPAKYESSDDFEPDETFYAMIAARDHLYVVTPNHGQLLSVSQRGATSELIDISASQGHIVPTAVAERRGIFYIGNLNLFPIDPQWARILIISRGDWDDSFNMAPGFAFNPGYRVVNSKAGFTTVVAVDFGPDGLLYALELSDAPGNPAPGNGKVVRVNSSGDLEEVITGLSVPTGMTFGPDDALYISNFGAAPGPAGQILRFEIPFGS
jgi:hypothetical protein